VLTLQLLRRPRAARPTTSTATGTTAFLNARTSTRPSSSRCAAFLFSRRDVVALLTMLYTLQAFGAHFNYEFSQLEKAWWPASVDRLSRQYPVPLNLFAGPHKPGDNFPPQYLERASPLSLSPSRSTASRRRAPQADMPSPRRRRTRSAQGPRFQAAGRAGHARAHPGRQGRARGVAVPRLLRHERGRTVLRRRPLLFAGAPIFLVALVDLYRAS